MISPTQAGANTPHPGTTLGRGVTPVPPLGLAAPALPAPPDLEDDTASWMPTTDEECSEEGVEMDMGSKRRRRGGGAIWLGPWGHAELRAT
jgi:hypothetical protein